MMNSAVSFLLVGIIATLALAQDFEPIKPNQVPCIKFDDCGVCLGDNSSCTDCAGVVNGDAVVDACGECGGDGSACASLSNGVTTTSFESSAVSASVLSAATTLVAVAAVAVN